MSSVSVRPKSFFVVAASCCASYLLLLVLGGRALQLRLAPEWLLAVGGVVHRWGSIGVQERLPWRAEGEGV